MPPHRPAVERFWEKVNKTDTCWLWTAGTYPSGYGSFFPTRRTSTHAHRYAWELVNGPIPDGVYACHTCDNHGCVNPEHLFLGTQTDNMRDMVAKGRIRPHQRGITHCKHGHEYTPENTYHRKRAKGGRSCKACHVIWRKQSYARADN